MGRQFHAGQCLQGLVVDTILVFSYGDWAELSLLSNILCTD